MQQFANIFDLVVGTVEKFVFIISAVLVVGVSAIVCAELVCRNLGRSLIIVEELSIIFLGWLSFFCGAYAFRKRGHVAVDVLFAKFAKPVKYTLYTLTYVAGCIFMVYIIRASADFAKMQMLIPLTQSRLPRGLTYMGLPVGGCFILFFLITDLIETLVLRREDSMISQEEIQDRELAAMKDADLSEYLHDADEGKGELNP